MRFNRNQARLILLWLSRRKRHGRMRQHYVRPAHCRPMCTRMEIFYRYYESADPQDLKNFLRFTPELFDELFAMIQGHLNVFARRHRYPIKPLEKLAIGLR